MTRTPLPDELGEGVFEEFAIGEAGREAGLVEGVDQQGIDAFFGLLQIFGAVGLQDPQARAVGRQFEGIAQRNHIGVEFDGGQLRAGQPVVAELDQRAAAEADQVDAFRARMEEQESHHFLRVAQFKAVRRAQRHGALHQAHIEIEEALLAIVDDEGLRVAFVEQLGAQFAGRGGGRFKQQYGAAFRFERARHLEQRCGVRHPAAGVQSGSSLARSRKTNSLPAAVSSQVKGSAG